MLRIAVGASGYLTNISRDGKLLPCIEATIFLNASKPTEVLLKYVEHDGKELRFFEETVIATKEDVILATAV
jgi:hypothetical protein